MDPDNAYLRYDVTIRQQPLHARISAMKVSDRRPVDPPIIVQLSVTDRRDVGSRAPSSRTSHRLLTRHSHLVNPYYFMYAALVEANNDTEVKYIGDDGRPSTSGSLIASVRVLKDHPNSDDDAAFFIFPNICVRIEGSWRFKLSLFVIDGDKVRSCAEVMSAPFFVYLGKSYPGVQVSTPLTRALAAQGVKLRIRKEVRERTSGRRRDEEAPTTPLSATREDSSSPSSGDSTPFTSQSPPKRRRTLTSPIDGLHFFDPPPSSDVSTVGRIQRPQHILPALPFYPPPDKPAQQSHPRRASLDLHRPYPNHNRDSWFAPRSVEEEYPQPSLQQTFTNEISLPTPKSEPETDYAIQTQWALERPAHPSPEMLFERRVGIALESEQRQAAAYSWAPSSRDFNNNLFSPSDAALPINTPVQPQFALGPASNFWQMPVGAVPRQRHGSEQRQQQHQQQLSIVQQRPIERYAYAGRQRDLVSAEFDWGSQ
ncbi:velvet factor-domain-containing protein [Mycena filopes]|nr:velvet factor-domain-containing protein [Mycena filopes]